VDESWPMILGVGGICLNASCSLLSRSLRTIWLYCVYRRTFVRQNFGAYMSILHTSWSKAERYCNQRLVRGGTGCVTDSALKFVNNNSTNLFNYANGNQLLLLLDHTYLLNMLKIHFPCYFIFTMLNMIELFAMLFILPC
jgi:hypothetical protein